MRSKPIDPMCPVKEVTEDQFSKLFWRLEETDRYYHHQAMLIQGRVALWNWDEGCWWYSQVISILADAARRGMEQLEAAGMKAIG